MTEKLNKVVELLKEKEFVYNVKIMRGGYSSIDNDDLFEVIIERKRTRKRRGNPGLPFCSYIMLPAKIMEERSAEALVMDILEVIDQEDK